MAGDLENKSRRQCLPPVVLPHHYDLHIAVLPGGEGFEGTVKIQIEPQEAGVSSFSINSKNLKWSLCKVNGDSNVSLQEDKEEETMELKLPKALEAKVLANLEISFAASFEESAMEGFYKSLYREDPLYSTHFEPTDARRAFPCFDQPDMKATFSVSVKVPDESFVALSNSKLASKEGNVYTFAKTPPMSTYIVAFIVGKLAFVETMMSRGGKSEKVPIRVYAHKDEVAWGEYALQVASRCLAFYEGYFGIEYPLPKLDMVAIPSFAMGAMENWGLVTYRSTSLLFDPSATSLRNKKYIALTICHELAHMWFGNLVTMAWWSDLWLNEGFATWAATLAAVNALGDVLPGWDAWSSFITDDIEGGMIRDCLKSTHPIAAQVSKPTDIDQIFDAISYSKGSSVIRMLETWISPPKFRDGLRKYLAEKKYSNAVTEDLWQALTDSYNSSVKAEADKISVASTIGPWIERGGFPLVVAEKESDHLVLSQQRFTAGFEEPTSSTSPPWPIPVRVLWVKEGDNEGEVASFIMSERGGVRIPLRAPFFKLNYGVSGFYRVSYTDDQVLNDLLGPSPSIKLHPNDIMNLYSDAFAIALTLKGPLPLRHVRLLSNAEDPELLESVLNHLHALASTFYDDSSKRSFFEKRILDICGKMADKVDLYHKPQTLNELTRDSLVLSKAVAMKHEPSLARFRQIKSLDDDGLAPEFIRSHYTAVVDDRFDELIKIYQSESTIGRRQHALIALGCVDDEKHLDQLLKEFKRIAPHDSVYFYASLGANLKFRDRVAASFIDNFEDIKRHIGNAGLIRHALESAVKNALSNALLPRVLKFLDAISADQTLTSAIDKCRDSIALKTKFRDHYKGTDFDRDFPSCS